jgi:DNA repair protein SbcD/Mre11
LPADWKENDEVSMFMFIHAADIHLDSPLRGLSRYESAPVEAMRDSCRRAFENLIDLAIEEKVAFVLLAGDLYDGDWKDYSTGIFLSRQMGRLAQHGILVFAVAGNHDAANRMTKALVHPENMKIFSTARAETVRLEQLGVAIHGRSFPTQHVSENFAAGFADAEKGLFNIGLLHTSLDGREGHAVYAPCTLADLRSKGYQYWALGHVHQQEIVCEDPWVVFPGCIQGRHSRETGAKGCVLISVDDGVVTDVRKIAMDVIRWVQCDVDITEVTEVFEVLERSRKQIEIEQADAEERPFAMRIIFAGATGIADELAAYPELLEQQIKALAAEIAGDALWIERVENRAVSRLDLEAVLTDDTALGRLLKEILTTPENTAEIDRLADCIADLRQKMPLEAFGPETALNVDDERTVRRLVEEATHMLVGRLLTEGGAK